MLKTARRLGVLVWVAGGVACSGGHPSFSQLSSVSGFSVDQVVVDAGLKIKPGFALSGGCSAQFSSLVVSFDGGASYQNLSDVASATMDCAGSGRYSVSFNKDISSYFSDASPYVSIHKLYLRASGPGGVSSSVSLVVDTTVPQSTAKLVNLGGYQTVNGYTVKTQISNASVIYAQVLQNGYMVKKAMVGRQ